ncbi:response regulator receiver domain [Sphingomonas sp. ST-64]|uniref:Response regulator receiver domain n=1 Tax=Sphingomonas plantiphila TaxID=3163295 RepID=A0ABW8YKJ9_9SPHN
MVDGGYAAAVKETFETKPLRTVLMIDDEFPSLSDVIRGVDNSKKFRQSDRALVLYEGFRRRQMICDVENDVGDVHADRFRKSDLIILDYNLGPTENDNEQSIRVLRELAGSKHFNTVVVYTADPELDDVWLAIVASLSGDWNGLPGALEGEAQEHWEKLSDTDQLPDPSIEAIKSYAERRDIRDIPSKVFAAAQKELEDLGVPKAATPKILEALIHRDLASRAGRWAGEPRRRAVGKAADGVRWIQSHNSFVAIVQKADASDEDASDPYGIMAHLGTALLAWRPNLIQVIMSEIQNILELEALTTEDEHLALGETQAALWYYLLQNVGAIDPDDGDDLRPPLASLVDKLVDGIRHRLSSDQALLELAGNAMRGELRDAGMKPDTWPDSKRVALIKKAGELTRAGKVDPKAVAFRLNSFLSTERFRRAHLSTGTVFRHGDEIWAATSPACDLVARQPGVDQAWSHAIHPMTALVAIKLHSGGELPSALTEATKGNHVFFELDGTPTALKLVNAVSQPSYEIFFAHNEGRVRLDGDRTVFTASRLMPLEDGSRGLVEQEFEVVGQLRGVNAIRALQSAGQHLSRVGLDFVSLPPN